MRPVISVFVLVVNCHDPSTLTHGSLNPGQTTYNSERTYSCATGYEGTPKSTCDAGGHWQTTGACAREFVPYMLIIKKML